MSKQQQQQFNSFKLVILFFFFFAGSLVLQERTEKPHRSVHGSATHFIDFLAHFNKHKNIKYETSFVLFANNITSVRNVFALNAPFH